MKSCSTFTAATLLLLVAVVGPPAAAFDDDGVLTNLAAEEVNFVGLLRTSLVVVVY